MIRVSIRDTGVGVPGDAVSTIFEPFKQVAGGRPGSGGLGLGLAVCRILVEAHGGRVWCESPGAGQGATFYIELAAVPNGRLASVPVQPSQAQERCAQRILLVDDHPDTLQILGRVLRLEGHEVTTATSVSDVRKLSPAAFDVVISDIGLGDGSGLEVMSHFSNTPVHGIAVSGYGTTADVQKSLAAGFSSHLTKPVSIDALLDAIREVRDAEATEAERPVRSKQNQSRER